LIEDLIDPRWFRVGGRVSDAVRRLVVPVGGLVAVAGL
jgi:hypothetical protein